MRVQYIFTKKGHKYCHIQPSAGLLSKIRSSSFCIWLLQTLYAAMHEPDGVKGVNALRREEPSLREQILEHESIGLLRDATACYDRAIQLESDQVHTHTHTQRSVCKR